jgi:hypothetical protein
MLGVDFFVSKILEKENLSLGCASVIGTENSV